MNTASANDQESAAEPQEAGAPSKNGTRLVLGLVAAVLVISALGAWAVNADRRARPGTPPQAAEVAGEIPPDGRPTPPAAEGAEGPTH